VLELSSYRNTSGPPLINRMGTHNPCLIEVPP
jgi:hypothetical protein